MAELAVAAVDLGATSGRVVLGRVDRNSVSIEVVSRFPNHPVRLIDGLHWNTVGLFGHIVDGLAELLRVAPDATSVGVDSWAIDYGLLREGRLLGNPYHYRDERISYVIDAVHEIIAPDELYRRNGLQFLPFTTLYQLVADRDLVGIADTMLLIPDLMTYWLSGERLAEVTNASTTGLLNVDSGAWDTELCHRLGIPTHLLPETIGPGERVGSLSPDLRVDRGNRLEVVTVGSHDTASAVVAVPMDPTSAVYISCGTWGLVGVETASPVVTPAAMAANFTNEGGVDGRTRLLHNVMGLWLLSETIRTWEAAGETIDLPKLIAEATQVTKVVSLFDPNDERLLAPVDMPAQIEAICDERGDPIPRSRAEMVRSILASLASAFAGAAHLAADLGGVDAKRIHMVGGGSLNTLLCQLTADASGLEVLAGPAEATAIGNVLVQARAAGTLSGELDGLRSVVERSVPIKSYRPRNRSNQ